MRTGPPDLFERDGVGGESLGRDVCAEGDAVNDEIG
jgi:hypothetical protein